MKKTYIIPELEVVRIQTQQMLAASVPPTLSGQSYEGETILAPDMGIPNLPGIDIPGFDLPGLNMPK